MESFFGIGLPELILILLIAGIVMGPERIGVAARWLGRVSAQLQAISRGFMNQLNAELDGIQDMDDIRGAVQDVQDLRSQVEQLKKELLSVTNGVAADSRRAIRHSEEDLKRTIAPPEKAILDSDPTTSNEAAEQEVVLPNRIDIDDDPEE